MYCIVEAFRTTILRQSLHCVYSLPTEKAKIVTPGQHAETQRIPEPPGRSDDTPHFRQALVPVAAG